MDWDMKIIGALLVGAVLATTLTACGKEEPSPTSAAALSWWAGATEADRSAACSAFLSDEVSFVDNLVTTMEKGGFETSHSDLVTFYTDACAA
jgi:hypothetical protein